MEVPPAACTITVPTPCFTIVNCAPRSLAVTAGRATVCVAPLFTVMVAPKSAVESVMPVSAAWVRYREIFALPLTSSFWAGVEVQIPTFPDEFTVSCIPL